jgi:hypothetical protein
MCGEFSFAPNITTMLGLIRRQLVINDALIVGCWNDLTESERGFTLLIQVG